ncbi:MAG: NUDIX hydrolase [Candidatus Aminicenantaceae bacterium]
MCNGEQSEGVILAAGGVIEQRTKQGLRIAVIYRQRYQEWGLPKGKLKAKKESPWSAALREVREEVGYSARITGFAGSTHYQVKGMPKIVLYWRMEPEGDCSFQPSKEVQKLEWLPPQEAIKRLAHEEERSLIANIFRLSKTYPKKSFKRAMKARWRQFFGSPRYSRLANALNQYDIELEWRIRKVDQFAYTEGWADASRQYLAEAIQALENHDIDSGWQYLHAAQAMEIWGYNDEELNEKASILRGESVKIKPWRRDKTLELLDEKEGERSLIKSNVYRATVLRDEHFNNLYFKLGMRGRDLRILFAVLLLVIFALPILAAFSLMPQAIENAKTILAVELLGALGALFSMARTLTRGSLEANIPQEIFGSLVTFIRPVMGAAAALAGYIFLKIGMLPRILSSLTSDNMDFIILAVAFASGFSERLVIGAIEKWSAKT